MNPQTAAAVQIVKVVEEVSSQELNMSLNSILEVLVF